MAEALSKRIADIKIESDMLLLILENAYSTDSQGDQLRAKLREAVTQAGRCKANLAEFRIPSDIDTEIN
jgi:hypothetical protein